MREMEIQHDRMQKAYLTAYKHFMKYEEEGVDYFSDCNIEKRILTHPRNGDVEQKIAEAYGP